MPAKDDVVFKIRIEPHVKAWVEAQAKANRRSMTAEIAFHLDQARKGEKTMTTGQASQA